MPLLLPNLADMQSVPTGSLNLAITVPVPPVIAGDGRLAVSKSLLRQSETSETLDRRGTNKETHPWNTQRRGAHKTQGGSGQRDRIDNCRKSKTMPSQDI